MSVDFNSLQKIISGPSLESLLGDLGLNEPGTGIDLFVKGCITKTGGSLPVKTPIDNNNNTIETIINQNTVVRSLVNIIENENNLQNYYSIIVRDKLNIPLKDTSVSEICVFLNMMPTIVASSMVSYLDVEFETIYDGGTFSDERTPLPPGFLRFFLGSKKIDLKGFDQKLYDGSIIKNADTGVVDSKNNSINLDYSYMGMEMFTSPVTLTNATPNNNEVEILNPLTALASINSLSITVAPAGPGMGMLSLKTAKLEMTIHDRSRIGDFSQILNPQLSKSTSLWITYGWRYNNEINKDDPYSKLINGRMLWKERYRIKSSAYSFDGNGVKVTIDLFTDGETQTLQRKVARIGLGENQNIEAQFGMDDVTRIVKEIASAAGLDTENSVIGNEFLSTLLRHELPEIKEQKELNEKIEELRATLIGQTRAKTKPELSKKITDLINLIKTNYVLNKGTYKNLDEFKAIVSKKLSSKLQNFLTEPKKDKFIHPLWSDVKQNNVQVQNYLSVGTEIKANINKANRVKGQKLKNYISYGLLFEYFIGSATQKIPGVNEIQVFFGDLNNNAVCVSPTGRDELLGKVNISQYPIDVWQFLNDYKELIARRGADNINVSEVLNILNSQINDVRGVAYGFRKYVLPDNGKGDETKFVGQEDKSRKEYEKLKLERNFVTPQVGVKIEILPLKSSADIDDDLLLKYQSSARTFRKGTGAKNALRITVMDGNYVADMDEIVDLKFKKVTSSVDNIQKEQYYANPVNQLESIKNYRGGAVETVIRNMGLNANGDVRSLDFKSNKAVKDFVSAKLATIQIGGQGSLVTSVGASTNTDKLDASSRMLQKATPGQSFGALGINGTPLRVYPAQVTMTTIGCPIFEFGQSYFIDFNTGTDLDNKYVISGITHSFSPGKFSTSLNFRVADTYGQLRRSTSSPDDLLKMVLNTLK